MARITTTPSTYMHGVRQNKISPEQPLGILTGNFTLLLPVHACLNEPGGI